MDRQGHDYAAPMAYGQQQHQGANMPPQQQPFGFHPQQQFPPPAHGPPFLPPHPSLQQYPFHRPMQQPPYPHPPPHAHLLHLQQQRPPSAFPSHVPPHLVPSPFHGPYDSPPLPAPPPSDMELQKRIDKLVEYSAKNGPEFEAMIREKQQDNPDYSFLFGGEGHNYYRYKLWMATRSPGGHFSPSFPLSSISMLHPPNPMMSPSPLNASSAAAAPSGPMMGAPSMHQPPFPSFFDPQHPQHSQSFVGHGRPDYDQSYKSYKGLSKPLPSDVEMELNNVLNSLTGTKESIKGAKNWFMQRSPLLPSLAEALRDRIFSLDDSDRQLHIIYLANDILFDSLQRRINNPHDLGNEALAFKPVLGSMLARVYHNPINKEENQSRLQKIVQFWASKEVYDQDIIRTLENEMIGGMPKYPFPSSQRDLPNVLADPSATPGLSLQSANQHALQWQPERQSSHPNVADQDNQIPPRPLIPASMTTQQFHPASVPPSGFAGPLPVPPVQPASQQPAGHPLTAPTAIVGEKLPPYPLFPPGLIPGMVRKMQIGSGVPYSPLSPLDIPTIIPPSNVSPSEILERVSKFFKDIGEVNPSEGPMISEPKDEYDDYKRDSPVRTGGACIPPPPNLQVDSAFDEGGVEQDRGSGRPGLGATGTPNESSQYDDVYSSYRKQRSTNYHSSMSTRAATR